LLDVVVLVGADVAVVLGAVLAKCVVFAVFSDVFVLSEVVAEVVLVDVVLDMSNVVPVNASALPEVMVLVEVKVGAKVVLVNIMVLVEGPHTDPMILVNDAVVMDDDVEMTEFVVVAVVTLVAAGFVVIAVVVSIALVVVVVVVTTVMVTALAGMIRMQHSSTLQDEFAHVIFSIPGITS